ncbi:MAG: SRPBCC family protein [Solirubrobacterales bacterium]
MTPSFPKIDFAKHDVQLEGASILSQEQFVARPRAEVFEFFSDAQNLERLTPPWLNFQIVEIPDELAEGALIRYRLALRGLPLHWTTRIEEWVPGERFVDVQLSGPYSLWHHTHEFEDAEGGTLIRDVVRYRVPFGPIGEVVRRALVDRDTKKIFDYRREMIEREFASAS